MGNLKIRSILRTVIIEQKEEKFVTRRNTKVYMTGTFHVGFVETTLRSFWCIMQISDVNIFKTLLLPQFCVISAKLYCNILSMGLCWLVYVLVFYQLLKILCDFENFLNTGPYGTGNFKMPLFPQFTSHVSQISTKNILILEQ